MFSAIVSKPFTHRDHL